MNEVFKDKVLTKPPTVRMYLGRLQEFNKNIVSRMYFPHSGR